jgi:benzoyl-CoA 2,3-epoxidase subunit B
VTRDLFGAEISSNADEAFSAGIKGRFNEANLKGDDHVLTDATYPVTRVVDGKLVVEDAPALRALNARLLDDFIVDCQCGIDRWNKSIEKAGVAFKFVLRFISLLMKPCYEPGKHATWITPRRSASTTSPLPSST